MQELDISSKLGGTPKYVGLYHASQMHDLASVNKFGVCYSKYKLQIQFSYYL